MTDPFAWCQTDVHDVGVAPAAPSPQSPREFTLYVDFDGGRITRGERYDSSRNEVGPRGSVQGDYPAYSGGAQARAAVMEEFRSHWAAWPNVRITEERPASGEYAMVMVGPWSNGGGGARGIAPVDCGNTSNTDLAFAFVDPADGLGPAVHAKIMSHEVGHTLGLNHSSIDDDMMSSGKVAATFRPECMWTFSIAAADYRASCQEQHDVHCGVGNNQSSWLEVDYVLGGPAETDPDVPSIDFETLQDGQDVEIGFPEGLETMIVASIDAPRGIEFVTLQVDDLPEKKVEAPPYEFPTRFKEGTHTLLLRMFDSVRGRAEARITVHAVEDPQPPPPRPGTTDGGDDGTSAGGGSGESGASVGTDTASAADDPAGGGTQSGTGGSARAGDGTGGCRSAGGGVWGVGLVLLGALRRRRESASVIEGNGR